MAWRYNLPKCPVSPADRGEDMKPTQKSAPALQAPHNSGERVQNGDTALAGADTPSSVSTPAQDVPGPMHRLIIGPRKVSTSCGLRVVANYPNSKTAMLVDGDHINCAEAPDNDRTRITCPKCLKKVPQP